MLYPLRFEPVYFEKVWGDRLLETIMHRDLPPGAPVGESWEVSTHPHGQSVVGNGPERGHTLEALIARDPAGILGAYVRARFGDRFPLLVKYLDASDRLSVQVHPGDEYALAHEGEPGKTEMWYVLYAKPDAQLIAGLKRGATPEAFRAALDGGGDPGALLHFLPVKTGDTIFIPAGRIHALLDGLLICEIQQNSDTTYRLYDWDRPGLDGKPRPLHIEQALAVTDWTDYEPEAQSGCTVLDEGNRVTELATCPYFTVMKYDLISEQIFAVEGESFHILNCIAGAGALTWPGGSETLSFGDSLLIPAALTDFAIQPDGEASFLLSWVPE